MPDATEPQALGLTTTEKDDLKLTLILAILIAVILGVAFGALCTTIAYRIHRNVVLAKEKKEKMP